MIQVHTRDGIFGPGGYGGGLFDGSNMGFGGLGSVEQAAAGIAGLTSPTQWTIGPNEWPSTVSQAVVKSGSRWRELPAANPGMKVVTVNGQANLSPWKVGQVVNLPASWVPTGASPSATIPANDVAFMIDVVNSILFDWGMSDVSAAANAVTASLCGAVEYIAQQIKSGAKVAQQQDAADFAELWSSYGAVVTATCATMKPWKAPVKTGASSTTAPPQAAPSQNPCLVTFGSSGAVVAEMQKTMNVVLVKNGYSTIPVSGTWDAATCGAMFALEGEWDPTIAMCPGGWQVPPGCPKGVTPVKPVKKDEPDASKSGTSMAWMVGGLVGAAALAAAYAMKKR